MSRAERPKSLSACSLIIATVSSPVTTIWATGLARKARLRTSARPDSSPWRIHRRRRVELIARRGRDVAILRKTRWSRLRGAEPVTVAEQHLGVPEKQHALRAPRPKCKRPSTFRCVSPLRYIRVLRQDNRSTREIGASFTRSLRPKMTARRRSLRNLVPAVGLLEIPREVFGGHRFDGSLVVPGRRVPRPARARRRRWHRSSPAAEGLGSKRFGQQHGQAVGLLAGRAAGAPQPNGVIRRRARRAASGMTSVRRNSHASVSRKKAVTLIRIVLNRAANSSALACSTSR